MSFDDLFYHAQRYASTDAKKQNKAAAKAALFARKAEALDDLCSRLATDNMWVTILMEELIGQLTATEAVPVLLKHAQSTDWHERKFAVFFLGFYGTPEHAEELEPLLDDDKVAGAAARTLGKWRDTGALDRLPRMLDAPEERRRIVAINALRDIGSLRAAPFLVAALADPVFTVRKAAAAALAAMNPRIADTLLDLLPETEGAQRRELIGVLGAFPSARTHRALQRLRTDPDPFVREDAALALEAQSRAASASAAK